MTPRIIYTKIVGDLFHIGHLRFLKAAKCCGDRLVVQVVGDERVAIYKHRRPVIPQAQRAETIAACRYVDSVELDGPREITLDFMNERGFACYAYGYADEREAAVKRRDCTTLPDDRIIIIPYTAGISTEALLQHIRSR